jgi:hypothetical protein
MDPTEFNQLLDKWLELHSSEAISASGQAEMHRIAALVMPNLIERFKHHCVPPKFTLPCIES